jgi:hypothetical protein
VIKDLFLRTYQAAEADALAEKLNPTPGSHRKTWVILVWTAVALTLISYAGNTENFAKFLGQCGLTGLQRQFTEWSIYHEAAQLHQLVWWALVSITHYMLIPMLLIRFVLREPLGDYGLRLNGAFQGWPLYVVMLAVMFPLVANFSGTAAFQQKYPFYQPNPGEPLWPRFWIWELFYFGQFVALEFFFRGFMTLGLRPRFGFYSVLVMMVPYCMIHFRKPMPETFGAILAGIVLGTLSMKSRSVWLGVLIHYSVAITMDLFALWRRA